MRCLTEGKLEVVVEGRNQRLRTSQNATAMERARRLPLISIGPRSTNARHEPMKVRLELGHVQTEAGADGKPGRGAGGKGGQGSQDLYVSGPPVQCLV